MSKVSICGCVLAAASIAPFAILCATDALGWTGPSTGCGFVLLAVVGGSAGVLLWLVGLLASGDQRNTRGEGG